MKTISTSRSIAASCVITFILLFVHSVLAANDTWVGNGADANWATIANWAAVAAPVNNDTLAFNGTSQQINTNNISNLTVGSVTFTNGGFNLYGNALTVAGVFTGLAGVNTISMDLTDTVNNTTWNIASGSELRLAGAFFDSSGTIPLANLSGSGTLRIMSTNFVPTAFFTQTAGTVIFDGAVVSMLDGYRLRPGSGITTVVQFTNNGSLTIGLGGNLRLCQTVSGGASRVDMSSGTLNVATTTGGGAGDIFVGEAASTTTTFNQNGGLVEFTGNGNNRVAFANASAGANGTYNLNGGLLWTAQITQVTAGSPGGTFNFNGGTLKPTISSTTFFQGVQAANIQSGGAIIDTTNLNITIGESLPGVGGLTKLGTGNLTLSGANTYAGSTVVSNGDLITTTASIGAGSYTVADGAELDVQVAAAGKSLTNSSLTLGVSGSLRNNFVLGANASTTVPAVTVKGALNLNGTVNVTVTGTGLTAPNTYLLMSYGSFSGTGSFVAGTLPTIAGYVATLTNNTTANQLQLVYALAPQAVKWAVGDGSWDTSSLNWNLLSGAGPTNYVEGAPAVFDDSSSGSSPITVTLSANRSPSSITNNNSTKNYIIAGSSSILGSPVTMNGGGTFIIDNGSANTFSSVVINAGTVQLGNNDTSGSLGSGAITDNGTLALNRTDNLNFGNAISGTGGVVQNGSGSVTLTAANNYAGTTAINAGDVIMGNASALSTNTINITNGGTLDINGNAVANSELQPVNVSGNGAGGVGAIVNSVYNGGLGQNNAFRNVTLAGDTTIGGGGTIGLRTIANSDPGLIANGHMLIVKMTNNSALNLNGGTTVAGITNTWFLDIGNIDIQQGFLSFQRHSGLGNPTNTVTVETGASLSLFSLTPTNPVPTNHIVMNNGALQGTGGTAGDTNTLGSQITLNGATNAINTTASTILTLNGPIVGTGGVVYGGTVNLSGANTYTGNTVIANGVLALVGSGSITGSSNIAINAGATFDVSAISSYTLSGGTSLSASGTGTNVGTSAAAIKGGTSVSLGSQPITLTYDGSDPALYISQGTLSLNANAFTVNSASPLAAGTYTIVQQASGNITSAGTYAVTGTAIGAGTTGSISVSGGNVVLTIQNITSTTLTRTVGTSPSTYGTSLAFHAVVSPDPGDGSMITFETNGVSFGTSTTASGAADLTTSTLVYSGGSAYTVTAVFGGNATNTSSSGTLSGGQQVNQATPTLTAPTASAITYGQTLASSSLSGGAATNTANNAAVDGTFAFTTSTIAPNAGSTNVSVTFTPTDMTDYTTTTAMVTVSVNQASTSVAVSSSENPSGYGDSVVFTATLPADTANTATAQFLTNGVVFDTETVSGGIANSLSITNLPRGTNEITVQYAGDGINYLGSTNDLVGGQIVTNHPPVAEDVTYYRAEGYPLTIYLTNLFTNVTDVDGDTITLTGVGTGTNGATITTNSISITYLPPNGVSNNANDSFTYTVDDGYGGGATANINVYVVNATGPAQIEAPNGGVVNITFYGLPGYNYVVETATNVTFTPSWPLSTNTPGSDGSWIFTDPNATNAQQYYRLTQP